MRRLTFQVLAVLHGGAADGQEILRRLRELGDAGAEPSLPSLYRSLRGGVREGWVEAIASDADASRGRPPQTYRLTAAGSEAVALEARRHLDLATLVLGTEAPGRRGES